MTTFQGLPGDRNSSRILRPPGGGDSNIFGTDPIPPPCPTRGGHQSQVSNIFGEPLETHSPPKAKEDTAKNIFGVGVNEEEQAKEATSAQEKKKGTYNPITGEGYDDTQAAAGTRVRQPPGGYSSKLW